jgi:hypothetical protein
MSRIIIIYHRVFFVANVLKQCKVKVFVFVFLFFYIKEPQFGLGVPPPAPPVLRTASPRGALRAPRGGGVACCGVLVLRFTSHRFGRSLRFLPRAPTPAHAAARKKPT